jgi:Baseplate J-like protein
VAQLPIVMGPQGPIPTPPATLRAQLVALVSADNPGYTSDLPGSLIEDIVSTDVGGIVISNQFFIDLINSITPYGANPFILNQLGVGIYGIQPAQATNTSVNVLFSGTPGFIIIPGFTITDGQYQYICNDGGVIGTDGNSLPINAIATVAGTWSVPSGTVTGLITSVPITITLTVTNPTDGIPSIATETITSFRTRTLTAGLAASTGMDRYLKTILWNIPGVVQRLVSVRQDLDNGRWIVLVGGGDPYQVAWAIYYSLFDIQTLARPTIDIINMTNTNPIVITTSFNHNLLTGMNETLNQIIGMNIITDGLNALNGNQYSVTVMNDKTFSIPYDGTTLTPWVSGGIVTPNPLLQQISLLSYPDTYVIPYILPAQQLVTMVVTWNSDSVNYISPQAMSQAAAPALVDYINNLYVGTFPLNIFEMQAIFLESIPAIVAPENITVLTFAVSFDGNGQTPLPGTGIIPGDPYSYFATTLNNVTVVQA